MKEVCTSVCRGWIWISQQFGEPIVEGDCSLCVYGVPAFMLMVETGACVFLYSCHPEVNMKDARLNGTSAGLWNLLFRPLCKYSKYTYTDTHTWMKTLTYMQSTKGACGETDSHKYTPRHPHTQTHPHTKKAKTSTYTWWVFDHQLSSHSLSGCLVTKVLISSSSMNPHHHLTAQSTRCHLVCTWVFCYKLTLLFSWI